MARFTGFVLLLGIVAPVLGGPWNTERLVRTLTRVSFKECNLDPSERQTCGDYSTTEEKCYERECCWGPSEDYEVPRCYHSTKTNSKACAAGEETREKCGWSDIRKEQCLHLECCWRPSDKNKTWCIQRGRVPIYTGECGKTAIKPHTFGRIINGEDAIPHSWPWMVSLQTMGQHFCGGSLINEQWVLSAGHCYQGTDGIVVILGAHNVSSQDTEDTKITIGVSKAFQHESYGDMESSDPQLFGGVEFDYMLMKLEQPVEFNDVISPLCLAAAPPSDHQHCYSMGWGLDEFNAENYEMHAPDILQQFMSPAVDSARCNSPEMYNGRVSTTAMCAGYEEGGRGNCFGDSGGPLVTKVNGRWSQVGIVSWGEPCALAMFPTIYAEVSQMVEWMEQIVADN